MSKIFIDRPIFAWVIAIIIMLMGIGAIISLPVAQYPDVAPTQINIRATFPGASAATLESSVTQILEQQLTGIDGLLYFQSSSTARGQVSISVILRKGIDPDIAQVQVQNAIQTSISRLPQQVQQQGVRVSKSSPDLLLIVAIYDETDKSTNFDVSDWLTTNMQDDLSRIPGVGDVNVFGSSYAMRIWLDPHKLASFQLMPGDVGHRHPEPEHRSRRGGSRWRAATRRSDAQCNRDRAVAASDARAVPQHHRQGRSERRAGAPQRRRAGRARRRQLFGTDPRQWPSRRGHRYQS